MLSDQQKANIEVSGFFKPMVDFFFPQISDFIGVLHWTVGEGVSYLIRDGFEAAASLRAHPALGANFCAVCWRIFPPAVLHECIALGAGLSESVEF